MIRSKTCTALLVGLAFVAGRPVLAQQFNSDSYLSKPHAPLTLPFLNNALSWDIMPGASVNPTYGPEGDVVWNFTYATRLAWYPTSPTWSLLGEVVGAEGDGTAPPE